MVGSGAGTAGAVSLGVGTGASDGDGPGVALSDGLAVAGIDGEAAPWATATPSGPADGGAAVRTAASTTAADSKSTAAAAASHRRRSDKNDHMLHGGTTGHSRARAEMPGISPTPKQRGVTSAPMLTLRMGAV